MNGQVICEDSPTAACCQSRGPFSFWTVVSFVTCFFPFPKDSYHLGGEISLPTTLRGTAIRRWWERLFKRSIKLASLFADCRNSSHKQVLFGKAVPNSLYL